MVPRMRPVLIAAALVLGACGQPSMAETPPPPTTAATAATPTTAAVPRSNTIISVENTQSKTDPAYEITLVYPQIFNSEHPSDAAFNRLASEYAISQSNEFIAGVTPPADLDPTIPPTSTLTLNYTVTMINDDLISVLFDVGTYNSGAAHPNSFVHSFNYDRAAAAPLDLAALFRADAPYLERIAAYCRDRLSATGALEFAEGAEPTVENYQNWNLTAEGLQIIFNPYQVAPYVWGPQQVVIPFAELREIAAPDGLLARLGR